METIIEEQRIWILALVLPLVLAEIIWNWKNDRKVYESKDTLTNLLIMVGHQIFKILLVGYQLSILNFISKFSFFELPQNALVFLVCFILSDFIYYWYHRLSHKLQLLWAFHLVHHSSTKMNYSTAYRLHWLNGLITPLFYVPLMLIGFPLYFLVLSISLNLVYQFFLHTQMIGKLGKVEGLLGTPSAHRVHHGKNPEYIDKNFGGVFMIWDKLFGTYEEEKANPEYGITEGNVGYNPIKIMIRGFLYKLQIKKPITK